MSQPTQEFPPWLSPSAVVITDAGGNPVATETTIVYIPPTYFGPSIPLGSLYIFGGTTEPPSIALPSAPPSTTTAVPPSISTTATPTTTPTTILTTSVTPTTSSSLSLSVSVSSTSATPTSSILSISSSASSVSLTTSSTSTLSSSSSGLSTSSSSLSLSSSASVTTTTSSTPTSSTVPVPIHASGLSRGQLVGVIVASILGLIFLFVLALFLFLCLKGRRNRRQFATLTPIDEDYYIIPSGSRPPGEGSPRHSGEEADPFLQRSSGLAWSPTWSSPAPAAAAGVGAAAMTQVPSQADSRNGASRVQPPPVATTGSNSSGSTNSNASGFGVLLDRPSLGLLPSMPEHEEVGGTPLSPSQMARIGRESVLPDNGDQYGNYGDEEYTGAFAYSQDPPMPPRLVDSTPRTPLLAGDLPQVTAQPSKLSNKSSLGLSDPEEAATLLTAQRVRVEDLGPRTTPRHSPSAGPSTGFLGALGGLASNIGRLSWFKSHDSPRNSMATPSYLVDPLSEKDLETGRSFLSPDVRQADSFGNRPRGLAVGVGADGTRPTSTVSGRSGASGGTMYHDAQSSLPGTPLLPVPPPRAITPTEPVPTEQSWLASPLASPPAYTDRPLASSTPPPSGSPHGSNSNINTATDILDMPAPAALDHFATISSSKDSPMSSSFGSKAAMFPPPGLETIKAVGWAADSTAKGGASAGVSNGLGLGLERPAQAISIDILEEAPPDAEQGWRTISSGSSGIDHSGRRGTFGMFMHGHGVSSEQASLHSMRSHFTPSNRSTGSAPASRLDMGSIGSNSSRPSAHSVALSIGSGVSAAAHSLLRAGSISSDEQRSRFSPSLSAFGHGHQLHTSSGQGSQAQEPQLAPVIGTPPSVHMSPDKSTTVRSVGSGSPTILDTSFETTRAGGGGGGLQHERSISPSNTSFSMNAPWAGGLSNDWQASEP